MEPTYHVRMDPDKVWYKVRPAMQTDPAPEATPEACANCWFMRDLECHRHAPRPGEYRMAYWPGIPVTEWCGEYARRLP